MKKKVTIASKPGLKEKEAVTPDEWVGMANKPEPGEPTKRFTVDVPLSLHTRVKTSCAMEGIKMADVVRHLLEQRFPRERNED